MIFYAFWKKQREKIKISKNNLKGFTLIEILLVVGLVAIISAIVFFLISPLSSFNKVKTYKIIHGQKELEAALSQYFIDNGSWPIIDDGTLIPLGLSSNNCQSTYSYRNGQEDVSDSTCEDISSFLSPDFLISLPIATEADDEQEIGYAAKVLNGRPQVYIKNSSLDEVGGQAGDFYTSSSNQPPTATSITFGPILKSNTDIIVSYVYSDPESDPEAESVIEIYQADDASGLGEVFVLSSTSTTNNLPLSTEGKFIRVGVTPIASSGQTIGSQSFSSWLGPVEDASYLATNGLVVIKSTSQTPLPGSGAYSSKTWTLTTGSDGSNSYYVASPNTGQNTLDNLLGPRFDYEINFTEVGTYRVFVRMNGPGGTNDSVHVSLDGTPLTYGRFGMTRQGWGWVSTVNGRPGPDQVEFNITSPGVRTVSVWMREDGTEYDCFVLKHTTLQGTSNPSGNSCPTETGK